jgi:hypothetical protein
MCAQYGASRAAVSSVEPSSTTMISDGRTDCARTLSSVWAMKRLQL